MREILFRGKRRDNGKWYEGDLGTVAHKRFIDDGRDNERVIPETVGQYTGLIDKNGKKIFEGDICQIKDVSYVDETPFVVEWNNEYSGWFWRNLDYASANDTITPEIAKTAQVIGNIHDNPELLKGE